MKPPCRKCPYSSKQGQPCKTAATCKAFQEWLRSMRKTRRVNSVESRVRHNRERFDRRR